MDQFSENAIEADANDQSALPRLDMDVAGRRANGVEEDAIDQMADLDVLLGGLGLKILQGVVHLISEASRLAMLILIVALMLIAASFMLNGIKV